MMTPYWPSRFFAAHYWYERYWFGSLVAAGWKVGHRFVLYVFKEVHSELVA